MNRFENMKRQLRPGRAALAELDAKLAATKPARKSNFWVKRLLPAAASLLVIGGALAVARPWHWGQKPVITAPGGLQGGGAAAGLPVVRGRMSEIPQDPGAPQLDRIAFQDLRQFFKREMNAFVLARVTETQQLPPEPGAPWRGGRQRARLEALQWAWGQPVGAQAPVIYTVTQNLRGGCTMEEQTNLLRAGGLYLLPLTQYEGEWSLMGDLDVLFEVDDAGLLFSHSDFEAFAAYDEKPWRALFDDVLAITRDDTLLVNYPRLASVLDEGCPLVVLTVLDDGVQLGSDEYVDGEEFYSRRTHQSVKLERYERCGTQLTLPETFTLTTLGDETVLQKNGRYLVFVYDYMGEFNLEPNRAAKINADGSLAPLTEDWNCFAGFGTWEQVEGLLLTGALPKAE